MRRGILLARRGKLARRPGRLTQRPGEPRPRYSDASIFTVTAAPSIVTTWPVFSVEVSPSMPTIVGMPISRATMAEWERSCPSRSTRDPHTLGTCWGAHTGLRTQLIECHSSGHQVATTLARKAASIPRGIS